MNEKDNSNTNRRKPWVFIGVTISIVVFLGLMLTMTPKGFNMSHEQIGTGKTALVFIYDPNLAISIDQSEQLNIARDELNDQVLFLFATIGTPDGDKLIAKHGAKPAELLLFNPSGGLIKRQFALRQASELIQWLAIGAL